MRTFNRELRTPDLHRRKKKRGVRNTSRTNSQEDKENSNHKKTEKKILNPSRSQTLQNIVLQVPDKKYGNRLKPVSIKSSSKKSRLKSRSNSSKKRRNIKRKSKSRSSRKRRKSRKSSPKRKRKIRRARSTAGLDGAKNSVTEDDIRKMIHEKLRDFSPEERDLRVKHLIKITRNLSISEQDRESLVDLMSSPQNKEKVEKLNDNEIVINGQAFISKKMFEEWREREINKLKKKIEEEKKIKEVDELKEKQKKEEKGKEKEIQNPYSNRKNNERLLNIIKLENTPEREGEVDIGPSYEEFKRSSNKKSTKRRFTPTNTKLRPISSTKMLRSSSSNFKNYNSTGVRQFKTQEDFYSKYQVITKYSGIIKDLKLPKVHFAFRPKTWSFGKLIEKVEKMLDFRAKMQKEYRDKKKSKGIPQLPEMHNTDLFVKYYHEKLYPKAPQQKEKVI